MYSYAHYPSPQTNFYNASAPYTAGPYTTQYASHYATTPTSRPSPRGHARTASYGQGPPRSAPLRPPPMYAYPGSPSSPYQSEDYLSDEHAPPKSPKTPKAKPAIREVTDADRKYHDIPKGFSTKNWNPDEEPILLLGSVFDANSLGRWIYDWAAFAQNPHTAIPQMAADLWLLLIKTSGKMKQARETMSKIRSDSDKEMVDDFLDSGERIMDERLVKIVKKGEDYMMHKARKANGTKGGKVTLGKDSGVEFVECMFGRDRELINTEKLINALHVWNKRFDANCEEIIKNPSK